MEWGGLNTDSKRVECQGGQFVASCTQKQSEDLSVKASNKYSQIEGKFVWFYSSL